jgi:hypothetical protein
MCPTRDREMLAIGMIESVFATTTHADVALYIDDDQVARYADLRERFAGAPVTFYVGPRVGPVASFNRLAMAYSGYAAYGAMTDDATFSTPGWDQQALQAVQAQPVLGMVAHHGRFRRMDFPWVSREWVKRLGHFAHPRFQHYYWDVVIEVMAEAVGIKRFTKEQFAIDHLGVVGDEATMDDDMKAVMQVFAFEVPALIRKLRCDPTPR